MPFYIQSFEHNRWCVNNEPREIQAGQVVAFDQAHDADHFVKLERAALIGEFGTDEEAMIRLQHLVAEHEANIAAHQKAADEAAAAEAAVETKVVAPDNVETAEAAPKPAKKGKK